jgi:hypothetical protein
MIFGFPYMVFCSERVGKEFFIKTRLRGLPTGALAMTVQFVIAILTAFSGQAWQSRFANLSVCKLCWRSKLGLESIKWYKNLSSKLFKKPPI